jgi:molybdopterin-containing oxidoreductase family iron-sulfur binding subunit
MDSAAKPDPEKKAAESSRVLASVTPSRTSRDQVDDPLKDGDRPSATKPGGQAKPREIGRRQFMAALAAIGIGAELGTHIVSAAATAGRVASATKGSKNRLSQWTMILDLRKCDGCGTCTTACQDRHFLPKDQEWIKVHKVVGAGGQVSYLPTLCMMCENPPCEAVCPVGATFRTDEGLVLIDQNVCIGCKTCMAACPFEARYFNASPPPKVPRQPTPPTPMWPVPQQMGTVGKCVWCADGLPHGQLPACVTGCTMGVIYIGDLTTDVAVNGVGDVIKISQFLRDNDAVRLKEELGTNPRVYYVLGHGQNYEDL